MEYNSCGSACVSTCSNYFTTKACTLPCVEGCFCPDDKVRTFPCFADLVVFDVVFVVDVVGSMRCVRGYLLRRVASANVRVLKGSLLSVSVSTVSGLISILPKMFSRVLKVAGHLMLLF